MWSQDRHRDVGAYALGVLDEVDAFRFEDHLGTCPRCAVQVAEFGAAARQLMLYRRATPRAVHPFAGPGPRLLDRLLDEVAVRRRTVRRRSLFAVAAVAVFAVGGPAVAVVARADGQPETVAATDTGSGVWAEVRAEDRDWGSAIDLQVKDASGPRSCLLLAIGEDGSEETVATWTAPGPAGDPAGMHGGAAMRRGDIDHFEVRTADGERLLTLVSPWRRPGS
ncbi:zf-HC2 domain-containing protein [Streptomyces sp. CRN 30]|uniref:zf-HC2 domain-containing protein n=1 Tax=Streptomyces sp. CRN 30 TaxID=3075613 RepID=UPI002A83BF1C|nr:zf-HC2 domain-containing protein [Streptomyces sp. CRN 30]